VGEWWREGDVWLRLSNVEFRTDSINISLELWNKTGNSLIFEWSANQNFLLVDNTGYRYTGENSVKREVIEASQKADITTIYFDNHFFDLSVTNMTFIVTDLSRISRAQWYIPVPH
jgi:hypothetical protein